MDVQKPDDSFDSLSQAIPITVSAVGVKHPYSQFCRAVLALVTQRSRTPRGLNMGPDPDSART